MFTGIVTDIGTIQAREQRGDTRFRVQTAFDTATIDIGASICCSGICLTVIATGTDWFDVEASAETLACTNAGAWQAGRRINLERSLKVGDELGGHIVSGHVDGLAEVVNAEPEGDSLRLNFRVPDALAGFVAAKGSVALDGVSLTVNAVQGNVFGINLIPHTQQVTTLGGLKPGDKVNFEVDTLARYVARLRDWVNT